MRADQAFNLDALTDIISNGIGMVLMLALISLSAQGGRVGERELSVQQDSDKLPWFVVLRDDAMLIVDTTEIVGDVAAYYHAMEPDRLTATGTIRPVDLHWQRSADGERQVAVAHVDDSTNIIYVRFESTSTFQDIRSLAQSEDLPPGLDALDVDRHYVFAFVYSDVDPRTGEASGFATHAVFAALLKDKGVDFGWVPVDDDHPPFFCEGRACDYRPSVVAGEPS